MLIVDLQQVFAYHFMVNALRAGTIVAIVAGAVGWFMVLRQQTFAGHTLSVVSFPGAAGAILVGASVPLGYFAASILAALVIAAVPRPGSGRSLGEESAVIGTVQAFALACGVLFVTLYGGYLDGLTGLLFGTFLGITDLQVMVLALVGVSVLVMLAIIARPLLFSSVDGDVAAARGVPVRKLSTLFLVLLGCTAAEVSQITGALLVFSLLVMPAAAARQLTVRPGVSVGLTIVVAVTVTWLSLVVAYFTVYPVGFFVSTFGFAAFVCASATRAIMAWTGVRAVRLSTVGR
jgi:zinc/manganese transport system permease protein